VAALVEGLTADQVTVTLVNVNQLERLEVVVQAGGYGEHQFTSATIDGKKMALDAASFRVRLDPGAGAKLVLQMRRYVNLPTLAFPWDRADFLSQERR
jgi:hypothetical protein